MNELLLARGQLVRIAALASLDPDDPAARSVSGGLAQALLEDLHEVARGPDPTCWFGGAPRIGGWAPHVPTSLRGAFTALEARRGTGVRITLPLEVRSVEGFFGAHRGAPPATGLARLSTDDGCPPRRGPLAAARRALVRLLPRTGEPVSEAVPLAMAELLAGADEGALLALLAAPWKDEDATRRGAVQTALAGALAARRCGCDEGSTLDVALASLTAALLPPRSLRPDALVPLVAAQWRDHAPQVGLDHRMSLLLALADDDGTDLTEAGLVRLALAWQQARALGEPERVPERLREAPFLHAPAREALLARVGGAAVGTTWLLADGAVAVMVDDAQATPLVRVLADAQGRKVPASAAFVAARGEFAPHAPVDPAALGLDPTDALFLAGDAPL